MITPPVIKSGDTVVLVAPARKANKENIVEAIRILQSWGLKVVESSNLWADSHSYFSANDAQRLSDLQEALNDKTTKAIVCVRGGYGTTRIIDELNFTDFLQNPKWICGFSDITALHLKLQQLGVKSTHGTMPILFTKKDAASSVESLRKVLFGDVPTISFNPHEKNIHGTISGEVLGGNLSLLVDSLGTTTELDTRGKILIVEEIDEYVYKIDRMLVQLKRAGKFDHLAGMIVGHMTDILDTELSFGETLEEIFTHHLSSIKIPIAFNFPSGHENPNMAWIQGGKATLTVTAEGSTLVYS